MAKGGQQQASGQNSMDILYISAFFVLLGAGLWQTSSDVIVRYIYALKEHEISLIIFCLDYLHPIMDKFNLPEPNIKSLLFVQDNIINANPSGVTLEQLWFNMEAVGWFFIYPSLVVAFFMIVYLVFFSWAAKFNMNFSMQSLRKNDRALWPLISPVADKDLVKMSLDDKVWGMAQRPLEFAEKNNLLNKINKDGRPAITVNESAAHECFALQLGALWGGIESLPLHAQALFAIFAAKAEKDSEEANKLIEQIARSSYKNKKLDFTGTRELLVKHVSQSKAVGRAVGPHAYILTVMASLLEAARTDGVIATSEFLWLKTIDRPLWYMLNSVGRQTPFPEVAGPFAHWVVEKRLRRPLKVPVVGTAVKALVEAISEIKYNPDGY